MRRLLDVAKAALVDTHSGFKPYVDRIVLPKPGEDEIALVRKLVAKAIEDS